MKPSNSEKGIKHHVNKRGNVALDKIQEAVKTIKRNANLGLCAVLIAGAVTTTSCSADSPEVKKEKLRLEQKKLEEKEKEMQVDNVEEEIDAIEHREGLEKKKKELERDIEDAKENEKKIKKVVADDDKSGVSDNRTTEQKSFDRIRNK